VGVFDELDAGLRQMRANLFSDLSQGEIEAIVSDVEDFAADGLERRREDLDYAGGDISDVNEGPPLIAIVDGDDAILDGFGGEQVNDKVEARTRSQTEDGGKAKNGGVEGARTSLEKDAFGLQFGLRVERDGLGL